MIVPEWPRWTGVVLFVMAGGLLIWTFRSLGKNLTDTVVNAEGAHAGDQWPVRFGQPPVL